VLDPSLDPKMPLTRAEAQKVIRTVGLEYETNDTCPCDEVLYFGDNANALVCPKCGVSRYREDLRKKKVPRKVRHPYTLYFWDWNSLLFLHCIVHSKFLLTIFSFMVHHLQ
jgi:predicted RNA-binding Zn-ribbon protein involved in translation (DUF1610 family)